MITKIHKVGKSKCVVYKQAGQWIQLRFIPSAWKDKYYVITEGIEEQKHLCSLLDKENIIKIYGDAINELF